MSEPLYQRLRALVGRCYGYQGRAWRLVEVLADNDSLVLETCGRENVIQSDQYGQVGRRHNSELLTLPISSSDGEGFSEPVLELLANKLD